MHSHPGVNVKAATRDGDAFVLEGEKTSISLATQADGIILFARTGGPGAGGVSAFYVDLTSPGISRSAFSEASLSDAVSNASVA